MTELFNWDDARAYLERCLKRSLEAMVQAEGLQEVGRAQGHVAALNNLLRLPDVLREERELDKQERAVREGK